MCGKDDGIDCAKISGDIRISSSMYGDVLLGVLPPKFGGVMFNSSSILLLNFIHEIDEVELIIFCEFAFEDNL